MGHITTHLCLSRRPPVLFAALSCRGRPAHGIVSNGTCYAPLRGAGSKGTELFSSIRSLRNAFTSSACSRHRYLAGYGPHLAVSRSPVDRTLPHLVHLANGIETRFGVWFNIGSPRLESKYA